MTKTVTQLAKELGVSRQAIAKRLDNLPRNQQPKKIKGAYAITPQIEALIRGFYDKEGKKRDATNATKLDNQRNQRNQATQPQIKALNEQIKHLKEQAKEKDKQINNLHKLLDQQQQLSLANIQKLEVLELELKEQQEAPKKTWWQKMRGK